MPLDRELLREAREARQDLNELETRAHRARVNFEHSIRRLHASGASFREIGDILGLSHQRVHQIVDPSSGKGALRRHDPKAAETCNFCGVEPDPVGELIAGPGTFICARCLGLATEVLTTRVGLKIDGTTKLVGVGSKRSNARCTFCGRPRADVEGMVEAPLRPGVGRYARRSPGLRVCSDCLAVGLEILRGRQALSSARG